jgi:hypothetical protein
MRKRFVPLFVAVALAAPAYASAQSVLGTSFGFVGAVNLATFGGSDATGAKNKVSFSLGGFARIPMSPLWSFQPELEYAGKGAKESDNTGTATVDLSYIEIPLLFRVLGRHLGIDVLRERRGEREVVRLRRDRGRRIRVPDERNGALDRRALQLRTRRTRQRCEYEEPHPAVRGGPPALIEPVPER